MVILQETFDFFKGQIDEHSSDFGSLLSALQLCYKVEDCVTDLLLQMWVVSLYGRYKLHGLSVEFLLIRIRRIHVVWHIHVSLELRGRHLRGGTGHRSAAHVSGAHVVVVICTGSTSIAVSTILAIVAFVEAALVRSSLLSTTCLHSGEVSLLGRKSLE